LKIFGKNEKEMELFIYFCKGIGEKSGIIDALAYYFALD